MTAAVGLALVGVMAIRMTPGQSAHRDALVTVSTSSAFTGVSSDTFGELVEAAGSGGRRFTDLFGRTLTSLLSAADRNQASASTTSLSSGLPPGGDDNVEFAMVTPIGTDGLGVTTAAAIDGRSGTIQAMLPSGAIVTAELVTAEDDVAVVKLSTTGAATTTPRPGAADDWTVVAFGDAFSVSDDGGDLQALEVPEAAPIFDASGTLIGLCTIGPDGVEMLPVAALPDIAPPRAATESTERNEPAPSTASTEAAISESTGPGADPVAAEHPATSAETLPASTDVATTDGAASSSEPADDSEPVPTPRR